MTEHASLATSPQVGKNQSVYVMKFGGTSVGTGERMSRVADIVLEYSSAGCPSVVVLSAMSSYVKKEGTTSRLIAAANAAIKQDEDTMSNMLHLLQASHIVAIHEALGTTQESLTLQKDVSDLIDRLRQFLNAIATIGELSARSHDYIMGAGEVLSTKIFSGVLRQKISKLYRDEDEKPRVRWCDLSKIVPISNSDRLCDQAFFNDLRQSVCNAMTGDSGRKLGAKDVVVVTGYIGDMPGGILEAVGRGYTDFTASLIASGLQAQELIIWKEVDGIFSADPRKIKDARLLERVTPEEAAELTFYGSEVIHPFSMEQVMTRKIPIRIKNTFKPHLQGTLVDPTDAWDMKHWKTRGAVAVTAKEDVTVITLRSNRKHINHAFLAKLFGILHQHRVNVDMISTSEVDVSLTIAKKRGLDDAVAELRGLGEVEIKTGLAIISVIGQRMKHITGMAAAIFMVLGREGVNLEMISQGASEINVSCVIQQDQIMKATECLHEYIILQNPVHSGTQSPREEQAGFELEDLQASQPADAAAAQSVSPPESRSGSIDRRQARLPDEGVLRRSSGTGSQVTVAAAGSQKTTDADIVKIKAEPKTIPVDKSRANGGNEGCDAAAGQLGKSPNMTRVVSSPEFRTFLSEVNRETLLASANRQYAKTGSSNSATKQVSDTGTSVRFSFGSGDSNDDANGDDDCKRIERETRSLPEAPAAEVGARNGDAPAAEVGARNGDVQFPVDI
eukprot:Clim_evm11s15 gene=Clim_evmTU11s15